MNENIHRGILNLTFDPTNIFRTQPPPVQRINPEMPYQPTPQTQEHVSEQKNKESL